MIPSGTKSQSCPRTILDLIERFELHAESYRRDTYNETQVRRLIIGPEGHPAQIDAADRQIDQLAYELYALTDKEIRIVEEATPRGNALVNRQRMINA